MIYAQILLGRFCRFLLCDGHLHNFMRFVIIGVSEVKFMGAILSPHVHAGAAIFWGLIFFSICVYWAFLSKPESRKRIGNNIVRAISGWFNDLRNEAVRKNIK